MSGETDILLVQMIWDSTRERAVRGSFVKRESGRAKEEEESRNSSYSAGCIPRNQITKLSFDSLPIV